MLDDTSHQPLNLGRIQDSPTRTRTLTLRRPPPPPPPPTPLRSRRRPCRSQLERHHPKPKPKPGVRRRRFLAPCLSLLLSLTGGVRGQAGTANLTDAQVDIVVQTLAEGARLSWELGTQQQAILELNTPSFSVFSSSSKLPPSSSAPSSLNDVFSLITTVVQNKTRAVSANNLSYPEQFFPTDGSAADSAANGVAALIANWTGHQVNGSVNLNFGAQAEEQMAFLWSEKVPKTEDGAFSHRRNEVQLWSDFIYMVPPFMAYYGVLTSNRSMVESSYQQISLYRHYLRAKVPDSDNRLWKHIVLGSDIQDEGFWSTGNGWAAAGMLRVLATIQNSQYANALKEEMKDLRSWVNEVHDGMFEYIRDDGLFHNYANDSSTFVDAASAALFASTIYRQALLTNTYRHLPQAEFIRSKLWAPSSSSPSSSSSSSSSSNSSSTSYVNSSSLANTTHFSSQGWLTPVVNPHSFGQEGGESPEAQAFVVMMYSAWRDWVAAGAVGANAAVRGKGDVPGMIELALGVISVGVCVEWLGRVGVMSSSA